MAEEKKAASDQKNRWEVLLFWRKKKRNELQETLVESTDPKFNNGAVPIRILSILSALFQILFCAIMFSMAALKGKTGSEIESNISPTLIAFSVVESGTILYSFYDVYKTWKGTYSKRIVLSWNWQHKSFKRMAKIVSINGILFFPTILTFLEHSRGQNFWTVVSDSNLDHDLRQELILHLTSWPVLAVIAMGTVQFAGYTINIGRFREKAAEKDPFRRRFAITLDAFDVASKILAAANVGAGFAFFSALIDELKRSQNSGVVGFCVLYFLVAIPFALYNIALFFRSSHSKAWWIAFRALAAIYLFISYLTFWVVLMLIVLISTGADGFWAEVATLTYKRRGLIYAELSFFLAYCILSVFRVYYSKLRKESRQPRILLAQLPEAEGFEPLSEGKEQETAVAVPGDTREVLSSASGGDRGDGDLSSGREDVELGSGGGGGGGAEVVSELSPDDPRS